MNQEQQAALKAAVQRPPREAGIALADWHGKVVRRFISDRFGITLARSSCLTYVHRLGFVRKRPIKQLLKAHEAKREAFVAAYAALRGDARASGAKIFFVDEAHFYADVDLHATMGAQRHTGVGGIHQSPLWERRPATTPQSVWRRARWRPCPWKATAAQRHQSPSLNRSAPTTRQRSS